MDATKPEKQSVALAVVKEDDPSKVLLVRRPEDDEEFPGMWGLPAASRRPGETNEEVARRIGVQKLGADVRVGECVGFASRDRDSYVLTLCLYNASLDGGVPALPLPTGGRQSVTFYTGWRWGDPEELAESARNGSLCSELLLNDSTRHLDTL